MHGWKKALGLTGFAVLILGLLYLVGTFFYMDFVADHWWFRSVGYEAYFWQRQGYQYAVFTLSFLFCFLLFILNFRFSARILRAPSTHYAGAPQRSGKPRQLAALLASGSFKVVAPVGALLAVIVTYPLFREWQLTLLYWFAPKANVVDPVFAKDISYYLFSLPFYRLVQKRLLLAFLILAAGTTALYWIEWRAQPRTAEKLPRSIRIHLSCLLLFCFAFELWDHWLNRHELVYTGNHLPFHGPGFVEMWVGLPLIWSTILLLTALAAAGIFYVNWNRGLKAVIVIAALTLLSMAAGRTSLVHSLVQTYIVKPNEISSEKPYISNSIRATLDAYALNTVQSRKYQVEPLPTLAQAAVKPSVIRNIPVWDGELLEEVFKQTQGIRPYFSFSDVDVDRYSVEGFYQQVFVGVREIDPNGLPDSARNWINRHLKYTHGIGIVMTPAAQNGEEPMTWFIRDIPPRSDYSLSIGNPAIYFGLGNYDYAIAPSDIEEMSQGSSSSGSRAHYQGTGGVPISSLFRKLFYAIYFKDSNIFFTRKTRARSRILYKRNLLQRIRTLTPFLLFDRDPYIVSDKTGLYWIVDAYTASSWYPNAEPYDGRINYIRNAAKVVVDAYSGSVSYYLADPTDPISNAYRRIYPGLFKPLSDLKPELRRHLRYPRDLFEIQMRIYAKYHQTDPERFYNQEDTWQFARVYHGNQPSEINPYYVTLNLLNPDQHEFLLLCPMSPKGLDTLRALVVVGCDGNRYGRINTFYFPKSTQVYGPSQINALIDQDTRISREFTLWDQVGSAIERGKMLILPTAGRILYVQPVYLKSSARLKIPELKRIIVSQGEFVVMDTTLEAAFSTLQTRLQNRREQLELMKKKRSSPGSPAPAPEPETKEPKEGTRRTKPARTAG